VLHHLKDQLLQMLCRDESVRQQLSTEGLLFKGYHPMMEAVHLENAEHLRRIVQEHGWPCTDLVGENGAEAAWLVLQHSIGSPALMRDCRVLIESECKAGRAPWWQFAYLDDRIRVFEGKPQRYGSQFELKPSGPEINALEDSIQVDQWRKDVGLGPVSEVLAQAKLLPLPTQEEYEAQQVAAELWRRKIGWAT
jgi:hypothetical protein